MFKRYFQKRRDKARAFDVLLDSIVTRGDSLPYIMADNGKDTVVNRHLQARADELDRQADRLKRISDRLYGKG